MLRICLLTAALLPLGGCIMIPRIVVAEKINFDAPLPDHRPLSYNDLLCCYHCHA